MIRTSTGFLTLAILAASCAVSRADLINYTETFSSSYFLDGTFYSSPQQITFSGTADTASVSSVGGVYTVLLTGAEVTIGGLGTLSINDSVEEFDDQNETRLGVTDIDSGAGFSLKNTSVFDTYDLMTSIGPVSTDGTGLTEGDFATSSGELELDRPTVAASFTASPAAVPEPASIMLMAMGLGGVLSATRAARNRRVRPLSSGPPKNVFQGTNPDR